jgi:UDP-N-acetylmuramyl pentapeptide synthase
MARLRSVQSRTFLAIEAGARDALLALGLVAARVHRRRLGATTFVGVTGSAGKSTAKELATAILRTQLEGTTTPANSNRLSVVARTVLRTGPRADFCVAEVAAWRPGSVAQIARVLEPRVAVVTSVRSDHRSAFRTLEATAAEKAALVDALPPDGVAVLNADDALVLAMADRFAGRTIAFGESEDATLRAEDVRSAWPDALSFTVRLDGRTLPVRTRLNGAHWTTSVLAAIGVGLALGISVERSLEAVAAFEPLSGRMSPVSLDGITFVRDDTKAPLWSFGAILAFLAEARAPRKILVVGTISDSTGSMSRMYRRVARQSLDVADQVVFVGAGAPHVGRLGDGVHGFPTLRDAAEHLDGELRTGDLVVLKGSRRADHLARLVLTRTVGSRCWREDCRRPGACEDCRLLHVE